MLLGFFFSFSYLCPLSHRSSLSCMHTHTHAHTDTVYPALSPLPLFVAVGRLVTGRHCSLAQCVPGTVCVCVCCLLLLCQSTSLKYQLGTQTHNQNKLAALSPLVGVYVCMCLCARSGECMHVFMAVCVRARDADWTPFLLSLIEARGDTNTDLPQMNAWDVRLSQLCITVRPSLLGLKTKTITKPYLQFKFSQMQT